MKEQDFYRADPFAYWLIEKCRLTPLNLAIFSILISCILYLATAAVTQTLILNDQYLGLLQDWFTWVWICLLNPVIFGYYLWSVKAIFHLIEYLDQTDIVDTPEAEINFALLAYQKPWRKFLALALAIAFGIWYLTVQKNVHNWTGSGGGLPALTGAINAVALFYAGMMLAQTLITNVWVMQELLGNKQLKINPLHPDRCGGLSPLSEYSLNTAYIAAVVGLMISLSKYQFNAQGVADKYWYFDFVILLYIPLSLICFFGPLLAARKGMKKAKEQLLGEIAKQFQSDYVRVHDNLHSEAEILKKETAKLQELRSLYTLTNEFPVWPFDIITLRQYLLSVATPLVPVVLKLGEYIFKSIVK